MSIRIVLADDHMVFREGIRALIEKQTDMEVVAEAGDGRTAVHLVQKVSPNVVLMDISMPDMNGIEATRQIVAGFPNVKVVALSMHSERRFVMEMLRAGASGYLLKSATFNELGCAIRAVVANQTYLSPGITNIVVENYLSCSPTSAASAFSDLTDREREVLQILAEGKSTKQIALHLNVSPKTVESHRLRIMKKLNIYTMAELIKYAIREGLTSL